MCPQKKYSAGFLNKIAHRGRSRVQARPDAIEIRALGRSVAYQHQRPQFRESLQAIG